MESGDATKDSSNVLVHEKIFCCGKDCSRKWYQPIIGARYECLSCKKLCHKHNLCARCYQNYPYKSKQLAQTLADDEVQPETATAEGNGGIFESNLEEDGHKRELQGKPFVEHVFRCMSLLGTKRYHLEKMYDRQLLDKASKSKPIGDMLNRYAEFSQIEFVLRGILLYPFGVINLLLHRKFATNFRYSTENIHKIGA